MAFRPGSGLATIDHARMRRTVFSRPSVVFFRYPIVSTVCFELLLLVGLGVIGYTNPGNLGTLIALAVRYLFFPLLGLALVLWVRAGFEPGARRHKLRTLASLCFFSPIVAARAYYVDSIYLVLYYEAFWPAIYLAFAFVLASGAYGVATGRWGTESVSADGRIVVDVSACTVFEASRRHNAVAMVFVALILIAIAVPGTRVLLRDALQPQTVEGTIEYLRAQFPDDESANSGHRRRSGPGFELAGDYYVWVNGQRYRVTRDVFLQLRKGDHIRAEAGSGSGIILSIER
jgi:hypothetical protein